MLIRALRRFLMYHGHIFTNKDFRKGSAHRLLPQGAVGEAAHTRSPHSRASRTGWVSVSFHHTDPRPAGEGVSHGNTDKDALGYSQPLRVALKSDRFLVINIRMV